MSNGVRIPFDLFLPSPICSDGFGSAFGTTDGLGHSEGIAGGIGSGGGGVAWTGSTWSVSGGKAINTPGVGSNVVVNGGFDADTNWTKQTGWSISGGLAVFVSGATGFVFQNALVSGNWYAVTYTASGYSGSGAYQVEFGTTTNLGVGRTANGSYVDTGRSNGVSAGFRGASTVNISLDDVSFQALTLADLFASVLCSTPDVLADVAITLTAGTQAGLVLNLDSTSSPANFVIAYHDGTNCKLEKCVAGTYTTVVTASATYSANAVLRVSKIGTAYRLYYNNALVGSGTISDAGIVNNARHGLFSTYSQNTCDNVVVYASGSEDQYSVLNQY